MSERQKAALRKFRETQDALQRMVALGRSGAARERTTKAKATIRGNANLGTKDDVAAYLARVPVAPKYDDEEQ